MGRSRSILVTGGTGYLGPSPTKAAEFEGWTWAPSGPRSAPWHVLGPAYRWPLLLLPLYALLRRIPATRGADRLGLVTPRQMVAALVQAVEHPAQGTRIVDVPAIRAGIPDRDIEGEEDGEGERQLPDHRTSRWRG